MHGWKYFSNYGTITMVTVTEYAAAQEISGACLHDHIILVFTTLHWLPVHKRVTFNTLVLAWKLCSCCLCFRSSASQVSLNEPTTSSQSPWSASGASLSLVRQYGSLPAAPWRPDMTLYTFKRQLKAYPFNIWCVDVPSVNLQSGESIKLGEWLIAYTHFIRGLAQQ